MSVKEYREDVTISKVVKVEYFCDKCGAQIVRGNFEKKVSKAVFSTGFVYPESALVEYEEAYFCDICGRDIKRALEAYGAKFTTRTVDW